MAGEENGLQFPMMMRCRNDAGFGLKAATIHASIHSITGDEDVLEDGCWTIQLVLSLSPRRAIVVTYRLPSSFWEIHPPWSIQKRVRMLDWMLGLGLGIRSRSRVIQRGKACRPADMRAGRCQTNRDVRGKNPRQD